MFLYPSAPETAIAHDASDSQLLLYVVASSADLPHSVMLFSTRRLSREEPVDVQLQITQKKMQVRP